MDYVDVLRQIFNVVSERALGKPQKMFTGLSPEARIDFLCFCLVRCEEIFAGHFFTVISFY